MPNRFFLEKNLFVFKLESGEEFELKELTVKEFLIASRLTYEDLNNFFPFLNMPEKFKWKIFANKEFDRFLEEFNNFHIPLIVGAKEKEIKEVLAKNEGKNYLEILYENYKFILINVSLIARIPLQILYENYTIRQIQEIVNVIKIPKQKAQSEDYSNLNPGQRTKKKVTVDKWGVKKTTYTEVLERR